MIEIRGYASIFDTPDNENDVIQPGAFAETLRSGRSVPMLWGHDSMSPCGIWTNLYEDDRGLVVHGLVDEDFQYAGLLLKGGIRGLSIGYRSVLLRKLPAGGRLLKEIMLCEVSIVSVPCHPFTQFEIVPSETQEIAA